MRQDRSAVEQQIVDHGHSRSALEQKTAEKRADVARSTRDQYVF
jgi:hypothetical protein